MAAFSTNVIEMPDLASRAFQMYQIGLSQQEKAEEKAKLEQEKQTLKRERVSDIEGTRGVLEKAYSLEPAAREAASLIFKEYENAAINFNTTGSDTDKSRMNDLKGKFNQAIGQGMAIAEQKKREAEEYRLNPQMFTPDSSRIFEDRMKPIASFKPRVDENGILLGTYQGKEMPLMEIPYYGNEMIKGVNTLGLDRIDNTIKILSPGEMAQTAVQIYQDAEGVKKNVGGSTFYNEANFLNRADKWVDGELSLPGAMDKVYISHATNRLGLDPTKMSTSERLQILDKYKNPELAKEATEWWKKSFLDGVKNMIPAAQVGAPRGGGGGGSTYRQEKMIDYLDFIGFDNFTIEGGGQGRAIEKRKVIFDHQLEVSTLVPDMYGAETEEKQFIKKFGFDKDGKMYFVVVGRDGKIIPSNSPRFQYQDYLSQMSEELRKNRVLKILKDSSREILERGTGLNVDEAVASLQPKQ